MQVQSYSRRYDYQIVLFAPVFDHTNDKVAKKSPHIQLTSESCYLPQGMDSGFAGGEDENYTVYDKPWRQDRDIATSIYRPSKNIDKDQYGDDLDKLIRSNRLVIHSVVVDV